MPVAVAVPAFLVGALISLATSWVLVSRLERVGERLGLSEALLGIVAALAADAPEVTAAVAAIAGHQQRLGAGVVIGSNVFNLAALLGLGAVVAGRIRLHRKVVVLGGIVAMCVAVVCLVVVIGVLPPAAGLALVLGDSGPVRGDPGRRRSRPCAPAASSAVDRLAAVGRGRGGRGTRGGHPASAGAGAKTWQSAHWRWWWWSRRA